MSPPAEAVRPRSATVRRDGDAIVIDVPMDLRRRCGRKEIVLPKGVVPARPTDDRPPTPLAIAVARASRWQAMIETGKAKSNSDLARKLRLDPSYVARVVRLASLAPQIIEAILDEREPEGLSLNTLRQDLPLAWEEQRRVFSE